LFTSETSDPRWQRAHAILMAPFSMQAMEQCRRCRTSPTN
jgi:hypothetical protein